ncbi:MAG TPA: iron ABC transporter permease [Chroococcales cyanobacterium]
MRFSTLLLLLLAALALSICVGDVTITPQQAIEALMHSGGTGGSSATAEQAAAVSEIVWQVRLPRVLIALVVGVGLSVSGYILQSLSRNSLADPYLTGVSSGAGLSVALAMLAGIDFAFIPMAAFAGGLAASTVVAVMARTPAGLSVSRLLLSGVGLSAICAAVITMVIINSQSVWQGQGLFFWLAGGIAGRTWSEVAPAALYTGVGTVGALLMGKQMRLLSLGPSSAQALGLNVARTQWTLLAWAVLMCGAAVSVSGLVGFVGLIAPHLARRLFGRDERLHVICAALIGMLLVLLSDLAARTLGGGQELPLGTLLSLIGGPFFLWLVARHRPEGIGHD